MTSEPFIPFIVGICLCILLVSIFLRSINQPIVMGYILAGILLGPVLGIVSDDSLFTVIGSAGVMFLLFFIGMEMPLGSLIKQWRVLIIGPIVVTIISTLLMYLLSFVLGYSLEVAILLGFAISLGSTAVVVKILEDWKETNTKVGQTVIGILIVQDLLVVPMLIIMSFFGGEGPNLDHIIGQVIMMALILLFVLWMVQHKRFRLPFSKYIRKDHELQIFAAFAVCFGFAALTGSFGLSSALGAFIAGLMVSSSGDTRWVKKTTDSFRVVFLALFFVSIGLLIDLTVLRQKWVIIVISVGIILIMNTLLNAGVLRILGNTWAESFYAGALLSQIGEFSFILGAVALDSRIIAHQDYQLIIIIIAFSLMASPMWVGFFKRFCPDYSLSKA